MSRGPELTGRRAVGGPLLRQCLIAASVAFAVHVPALFAQFVYDDMAQILGNRWIRDLRHLGAIFAGSVWSFESGSGVSNFYRPTMHAIYALEVQLFGLRPWGFHLGENAFAERHLHLPSLGFAILLARLLTRVPGRAPRAALLGDLVALHAAGTVSRAMVWSDNLTLFRNTAAKSPDHHVSQTSLASALYEREEIDAAIVEGTRIRHGTDERKGAALEICAAGTGTGRTALASARP